MEQVTLFASIPAVLALVTIAKDLGLPYKLAPLLSVMLGISLALLDELASGAPATSEEVFTQVASGLIIGLSASGVYDGAKLVGGKKTDGTTDNNRVP